jgi:hypothetical protein
VRQGGHAFMRHAGEHPCAPRHAACRAAPRPPRGCPLPA